MALEAKPYLQEVSFRDPAAIDFSSYPWNIPAVRDLKNLAFHPDVTFLVGENGSGKSTVLEAVTRDFLNHYPGRLARLLADEPPA